MTRISLTVDGARVADDVEPRMLLVQYLRERLGKTGTVIGCDTSNCGACTVIVDGAPVRSSESADYGIAWIDKLQEMAEEWPDWRSQAEKDHVYAQFDSARDVYRQLKAEAGGN